MVKVNKYIILTPKAPWLSCLCPVSPPLIVALDSVVLFNSMESRSELVGGEQNGQTVHPLVSDQNDQNVTPSADEIKKAKKRATNKKTYRDGKKQKIENTKRQLEKVRAENDVLNNTIACLNGKLDQMQRDREALRRQRQTVEEQNTMINMLMQLLLPGFDTGETGLPTHHPPINQSGATMEPGSPVIEE